MTTEVSVDWKAALSKQVATKVSAPQKTGGVPHISLKAGRMSLEEKPIPNDELQCIIAGSMLERTWYDRPYDASDQAPPECFSLGKSAYDLTPHENVKNPPCGSCNGCPMAEFGSARQGRGPACKTRLRLLLVPCPDNVEPEQLVEPEMAILKVSPTSVYNFNGQGRGGRDPGYEVALAQQGLTPWAVVSKVSVRPHPKKLQEVKFDLVRPLEEPLMPNSFALFQKADEILSTPYKYPEEGDEQEKPATVGSAKY